MPKFTVIGLYDSTGEVLTCVQEANSEGEAMAITAREINAKGNGDDVQILCAVPGDLPSVTACEDSGHAAYAVDLGGKE